jgi:hypothetical protein
MIINGMACIDSALTRVGTELQTACKHQLALSTDRLEYSCNLVVNLYAEPLDFTLTKYN